MVKSMVKIVLVVNGVLALMVLTVILIAIK